jgi:hypothetical protein
MFIFRVCFPWRVCLSKLLNLKRPLEEKVGVATKQKEEKREKPKPEE